MSDMLFSEDDHAKMALALQVAKRGQRTASPNPSVGCVIAKAGQVISAGWTQAPGQAHAEVDALKKAGSAAQGATAYVTLEPCCTQGRTGPCTQALMDAGIRRVVFATLDPNPSVDGAGAAALRAAGIVVQQGLMADQAARLIEGFSARMQRGRPWLTLKLGMSLDGATAMSSGESQWITGKAARADVQSLRARADAILTGIGTVIADNPSLTVRDARYGEGVTQPMRVILDSALRMPLAAHVLRDDAVRLIVGSQPTSAALAHTSTGAEYLCVDRANDGLHLPTILQALAKREVNHVLAECGRTLAGGLVAAGLVDRFVFYVAPRLLGSETRGLLDTPAWLALEQGQSLRIEDIRQVGDDIRITATPEKGI